MSYPRIHLWRRPLVAGKPTQGSFMLESAPQIFRHLYVKCLELPWQDNRRGVSCIPPGGSGEEITYRLKFTHSPKYGRKMWLVDGVKGRAGIRIHSGNYAGIDESDSEGCLLPCIDWADLDKDGDMDGARSREAMQRLDTELRPFEETGVDFVVRNAKF